MEWIIYLLKVSACTALFYALYYLFLQRLTFFSLNRFYLLSALIVSFLIPALQLEVEMQVAVQREVMQEMLVPTVESFNPTDVSETAISAVRELPDSVSANSLFSEYSWKEIMATTYWLIVAVMLVLLVYQMIQLLRHIVKVNQKIGRLKVVYKPTGFTNCSFLNYVFVDQQDLKEEEIAVILQHEAVHANRLHSLDKLFVNVCKVFLWFNPLIYFYAQALEQVHEYEADQEASSIIGNTSYANLLLTIAVRKNNPPLAHSFVKSPLKARVEMLFTNQSKNMKKLTYLTALPLLAILLWSFSVAYVDKPSMKKYAEETTYYNAPVIYPEDSVKYRQKIERTPEMLKASAENFAWMKTEDFKTRSEFSRSINGKEIDVLVTSVDEVVNRAGKFTECFVDLEHKGGNVNCSFRLRTDLIKEVIKVGDKLGIKVYLSSFSEKSPTMIIPERITKNARLIFEMEKPASNAKPAPFLYEVNKVRYNNGVITEAGSVVAGKRTMEISANGYKFLIKINSNQVALSDLASFKEGDKVSLRFVHEVKTGTSTYTIADWVAISKDMRSYGVKNKQMFYRFYEKVPTDEKAVNTNSSAQQEPFIKTSTRNYKGHTYYNYEAKSPKGQKMSMSTASDRLKPKFVVDGKIYSFEEALKFDQTFLNKLSANQGGGPASLYSLEGLQQGDWVFWFGAEPRLSINERKNRDTYDKYYDKTLKVKVVGYSYSPKTKTLMDGFYVKTSDGVDMKVFIEAKYAKQVNGKLKTGDELTIVVKQIGYWKNENSIVIGNSKLIKNGVVLFERSRPV